MNSPWGVLTNPKVKGYFLGEVVFNSESIVMLKEISIEKPRGVSK